MYDDEDRPEMDGEDILAFFGVILLLVAIVFLALGASGHLPPGWF